MKGIWFIGTSPIFASASILFGQTVAVGPIEYDSTLSEILVMTEAHCGDPTQFPDECGEDTNGDGVPDSFPDPCQEYFTYSPVVGDIAVTTIDHPSGQGFCPVPDMEKNRTRSFLGASDDGTAAAINVDYFHRARAGSGNGLQSRTDVTLIFEVPTGDCVNYLISGDYSPNGHGVARFEFTLKNLGTAEVLYSGASEVNDFSGTLSAGSLSNQSGSVTGCLDAGSYELYVSAVVGDLIGFEAVDPEGEGAICISFWESGGSAPDCSDIDGDGIPNLPTAIESGESITGEFDGSLDGSSTCDADVTADQFYLLTTTENSLVRVDTCGSTADTALAIYDSEGTELHCNTTCGGDPCSDPAACIEYQVDAGNYLIRVAKEPSALAGGSNSFTLSALIEPILCPADLNGDVEVGVEDLLALLAAWGTPNADIDGDNDTGVSDLLILLADWGPCS